MTINIKATNTTLTDAIRQDIQNKIAILENFLKPEDVVYVEIEVDTKHNSGNIFSAEITILPHNHFAKATAEDMYAAIDMVIPKIREQLTKEKNKKFSLRRKLGALFKRRR